MNHGCTMKAGSAAVERRGRGEPVAGGALLKIGDLSRRLELTTPHSSIAERESQIRASMREQEILLQELEAACRCAGLCDGCQGKVFDSECIACLRDAANHSMPDCLRSLLKAASVPVTEVH